MAAEIRTLEDLVYDYEHEYRSLENEHESLKRENERLRQAIEGRSQTPLQLERTAPQSPLEFRPRQATEENIPEDPRPNLKPKQTESNESREPPTKQSSPSILDRSMPGSLQPSVSPPSTSNATPSIPGNLELPKIELPKTPDIQPPTSDGLLPSPSNQPSAKSPAKDSSASNVKLEIDPAQLVPPTIVPGEPVPPNQPLQFPKNSSTTRGAPNQLEINLGRIEIPNQHSENSGKVVPAASSRVITPQGIVSDRRIIEIAFHPTLCRSANLDDQPGDDGLYLVLQPLNERGQMISELGDLTIAVVDPTLNGKSTSIANWHFSAAEMRNKLQPIGSSQGIHLSLPWNGPAPISKRIEVDAIMTMQDGKRLWKRKTVDLSDSDQAKSVWVPRGTAGLPGH